jgi:cytochrome P450
LLAALLQEQAIEFIEDLAAKLPGRIIGSILGVPDEDCAQLRVWSEDIVQYFDADRTPERKALAESATAEFYEYLQMLIRERVKVPRTDLLTTLVRARDAGELDQRELVSTSLLILAAGHGSTIDVLGTGMLALLNHPEQMQQLRASPGLVEQAVQEMFRYESPLPYFHRYAAVDVEVMGRLFPAGTRFGLLYGSANRDAYAFPSAEEFHVDRQPNRHLAFGRGAHLCLGNNLARMSMAIVFRRLLEDTKSIELTEAAPVYRPGLSSRGLQHLRLSITAL